MLPPSAALPRGGLLVEAVRGRPARLPEDLPAIAEALAALHTLPLPAPAARAPLLAPADPWRAMRDEVADQAEHLDDAGWRESRDGVAGLMPEVSALETLIGELGIDNDDTVVVAAAGTGPTDFGSAARVYWTFRALGHDEVAILNGGVAGWQAQGFEVASGTPDAITASDFEGRLQDDLLATTAEVEAARESDAALVDARPVDFYRGETQSPAARAPGTIPGAVNLPHHAALVERDGAYYLDPERLKANIEALGLDPEAPTVAFCNTGHWAASGWFQLSEVGGLESVSMYDGSMAEWTRDDDRPLQLAERGTVSVGELVD